jgi:hypothetical protein
MSIRNRIKHHRRVRAGELLPHELNPRIHSDIQRETLAALYEEVGFARSLLAYELPDGKLKLIDGHLRRDLDPDMEVDVEVLDVTDDEARTLLLSIDPLAQLAGYDADLLDELRRITETDSEQLRQLWAAIDRTDKELRRDLDELQNNRPTEPPEQFLVLVECGNEEEQVALLERFQREGLRCRALVS